MADDLRSLAASFREASRRVSGDARTVLRKTTLDVEADAKRLAPVDTGNLKNSITHEFSGNAYFSEGVVGPTADYGIFVEIGTSRMRAQPFMGPAADRHAPAFEEAMAQLAERAANGQGA